MAKKALIILFVAIILCGIRVRINYINNIEEYAQKNADIIMTGNMKDISQVILGYSEINLLAATQNGQEDGILSEIFKRISIDVKSVNKNEIEYEIIAPDLSDFFVKLIDQNIVLSEEEFQKYIEEYIFQAELKKEIIAISYENVEGELKADYMDRAFINAITGGLLESYRKVYQEMLNEYSKGNI